MKTAIGTAGIYFEYIINMVKYGYNNGVIKGKKALKRIAFGYCSFYHFRNRILIMFELISIEKSGVDDAYATRETFDDF